MNHFSQNRRTSVSFLLKEKAFIKLNSDTNFVKFQGDILNYIKKFTNTIPKNEIIELIKKESYIDSILNIIKRYCRHCCRLRGHCRVTLRFAALKSQFITAAAVMPVPYII